ncbi:hypothetical protein QR680_005268 [Steinernema hermaphroditum]|uniref:Integrator complex subunit 14 C-terminal domain-containing protein n=1 Tax=Steinernema hermaphroditum TaxID=289476 RepID=A0AA39LVC2_9BILA|nr:hypothetical protein QR680_005268 [Steinernema hermaphroditum]
MCSDAGAIQDRPAFASSNPDSPAVSSLPCCDPEMNAVPGVVVALDLMPRSVDLDAEVFVFTAKFIERFRAVFPIHLVTFGDDSASVFARNVKDFPEELKKAPRTNLSLSLLQKTVEDDFDFAEVHSVVLISCGTTEYHIPPQLQFAVPLHFVFVSPEDHLDPEMGARAWELSLGLRHQPEGATPSEELLEATQPTFSDLFDSVGDCLGALEAKLGCRKTLCVEMGENLIFQVRCTPSVPPFRTNDKWSGPGAGVLSVVGSLKAALLPNIGSTCETVYALQRAPEARDADAFGAVAKSLGEDSMLLLCVLDGAFQCLLRPVRSEPKDAWGLTLQFVLSFGAEENRWQLTTGKMPVGGASYAVAVCVSYQCASSRNYWINDTGLQSEIHRLTRNLKREDKVDALYQDINRIGVHGIATSQPDFASTIAKILESRFTQIPPTMHGHLRLVLDVLRKEGFEGWSRLKRKI